MRSTFPVLVRNQKGFGLIEVMVASAVGATLMLAMASLIKFQMKSATGTRSTISRDQLASTFNRLIIDPVALTNTMNFTGSGSLPTHVNTMIQFCMAQLGSSTPCNANTPIGFTLVDRNNNPVAGRSSINAVAYDSYGKACGSTGTGGTYPTPDAKCPIIAYATYTATCPGGAASCATAAASITFTYTITQVATGLGLGGLRAVTNSSTVGMPLNTTGVQNYFAKWTSTTNVGASTVVLESATGNIGIGTTAPAQKLSVAGTIESTTGGVKFPDATTQTTAYPGFYTTPSITPLPYSATLAWGSTQGHTLGVAPTAIRLILTCIVADAGYSVGDVIVENGLIMVWNGTTSGTVTTWANASNLGFVVPAGYALFAENKVSATPTSLTLASWNYKLVAVK